MLDTQDAESRVQLGCRADRPVRREGSDIKALGPRTRCRVDERMAAQYHTKSFHKLSWYFRCNLERRNTVTKVPSGDETARRKYAPRALPGSFWEEIPKRALLLGTGAGEFRVTVRTPPTDPGMSS